MDKLAQERMMGALKTGKKPKALPLDKEDMKEMSKLGKGNFIKKEKGDVIKAKGYK
jgi:hypothetical protein